MDDFDFIHRTNSAAMKMANEDSTGNKQERRQLAKKNNIDQLRDVLITSLLHYCEMLALKAVDVHAACFGKFKN